MNPAACIQSYDCLDVICFDKVNNSDAQDKVVSDVFFDHRPYALTIIINIRD